MLEVYPKTGGAANKGNSTKVFPLAIASYRRPLLAILSVDQRGGTGFQPVIHGQDAHATSSE